MSLIISKNAKYNFNFLRFLQLEKISEEGVLSWVSLVFPCKPRLTGWSRKKNNFFYFIFSE